MEIIAGQNSSHDYFNNHNGTRPPTMIYLLMGMNILVHALHVTQSYRRKQRHQHQGKTRNSIEIDEAAESDRSDQSEDRTLLSPEKMILVPAQFYQAPGKNWPTIFGSMFTHAHLLHLMFNMAALYKFGRPLEHALGQSPPMSSNIAGPWTPWVSGLKVLLIYMSSGLLTNLIYAMLFRNSHRGIVGASGAISGIGAAYFLEYADQRSMNTWLGYQVVGALLAQESGISFVSHLIGFVIGALVYLLVRR